ncbi:Chitin synthase, class 7 [Ascosphaera aggregata]|nr:Chitin synthase, class 7 [Ascosphaera aggregata]
MGFGDFESLCRKAALPLCTLLGPESTPLGTRGILPTCYSRNIELANTIIFQGATDVAHIFALGVTVIMIIHIRSKFTAVGRKEIITFFYLYMALTLCSLVLDAGVAPPGSSVYPYFTAVQCGLVSAMCTCLLVNGFVGFQIYEDGTTLSVWLLRLSSAVMFAVSFAVSLVTFKSRAGLSPTKTLPLFIILFVLNAVFVAIYVVMQILLVVNTLQDRWPLGHITFAIFFFVAGQIILYVFSTTICNKIQHYVDGLFFATVCNLFAVMMIYKYWDSITKEDLEFSVGLKQNTWEVGDLVSDQYSKNAMYHESTADEYSSHHHYSSNSSHY